METQLHEWVASAAPEYLAQYQAMHTVIHAIASSPTLSPKMIMKGGVLLGVYYGSPRFTRDIDFSTADQYRDENKDAFKAALNEALTDAVNTLGYNLDCQVQQCKPSPKAEGSYVTLQIKIGYATFGTPAHKRLRNGQSPKVVEIDYSHNEVTCQTEHVKVGENGTLPVYAITDVIAEKYRAILQQSSPTRDFKKYRPNDIFDIDYLLKRVAFTMADRETIHQALLAKSNARQVHVRSDSLDDPLIQELSSRDYLTLRDEVYGEFPPFDEAYATVNAFYKSLPWLATHENDEEAINRQE